MNDPIKVITVTGGDDLEKIFAVRREVFVIEQRIDAALEYDEYDRPGSGSAHFLLTANGIPAGAARLIPYHDGFAKLQRVSVPARFRGYGYGRKIVEAAEVYARGAAYKGIVLHGQITVRGFYEKLGYQVSSEETFFEAGLEHVRMVKIY